jgi:hypothetical protein
LLLPPLMLKTQAKSQRRTSGRFITTMLLLSRGIAKVYYCRMPCDEFEKLEQSFIDVRRQRAEHLAKSTLTPAREEELSRAELKALYDLLDHRVDHGCQRGRTIRLPASRNIGGIIGPY